ncbi:SPOR domain-containing protein [Thiolapillus sp.]
MSIFSDDKPAENPAEKPSGQAQEAIGLEGESVDFNSVLSAVSGNGAQDAPEMPASGKQAAQKDLNLSSVIANIQDEGPAFAKEQLAAETKEPENTPEKTLQPTEHAPTESIEKTEEEKPEIPDKPQQQSPAKENPPRQIPAASTGGNSMAQNAVPVPWSSILMRLLVTVLLIGLAGMGYLLYTQEAATQKRDTTIAQLEGALEKLKHKIATLDQQLQQQQEQMSNFVTPAQMQEQLLSQRQSLDIWLQSELRSIQASQAAIAPEPAERVAEKKAIQAPQPQAAIAEKPASDENNSTAAGKGGKSGNWVVHIASYSNQNQAKKSLHRYHEQIPHAEIHAARVKGKEVFRISVPGFSSKKEALNYRKEISKKLGLKGAWIAKEKNK